MVNGLVCATSALAFVEEDLVALQVLALVHGCVADADDITASMLLLHVILNVMTGGRLNGVDDRWNRGFRGLCDASYLYLGACRLGRHEGHVDPVGHQDGLVIDLLKQAFLHHPNILLQVSLDLHVLKVEPARAGSTAPSCTGSEAALTYHTGRAHLHPLPCRLDCLLTQLMVPLYATDWQFAPVDIPKLITRPDALIGAAGPVLGVPLFAQVLIGGHIVHHLKVHLGGEAPQHEEKGHAVDQTYAIPDLNGLHELTLLYFFFLF